MDLALDENQTMLRSAAEEFVERECPKAVLLDLDQSERGVTDAIWQKASDVGWLGMLVPEQYGGSGNSLTDAAVLYEQLGRGPVSGPFFSSGVLGALVVLECGLDEQKSRFLPQIASGTEVFTLAMTEPDYGWDAASVQMRAEAAPGGYVLNGTKLFVQDPMAATRFMCVFKTGDADGDIGIALVDASASGMRRRIMPGFLGWSGEIVFDNVRVAEEDVIVRSGGIWDSLQRAFEKAIPVLCAYKVGGSQAVFDISLAYSQTREQFGQPIGRFQRVQDHIIGIVNHLDAARWATYEALWKLDAGKPAGTSVHLAKAVASEAYYQACNGAHEVHAGVGVSREYGLTLHTRASRTLYHFLGDPKFHRRRLAKVLDI